LFRLCSNDAKQGFLAMALLTLYQRREDPIKGGLKIAGAKMALSGLPQSGATEMRC